jgi:hypothetical protein
MDRLAKYASADKAVMQRLLEMRAFERFRDAIARIISAQVCGNGCCCSMRQVVQVLQK